MGPYNRLFDRDGDGTLDFHEDYARMDFEDYVNKRGIYAEEESDDDDDDLWGDDDDGLGDDDF
ncbi:MAG: hypothetical protein K5770_16500 [Lachnospiraceae bacterium]|nr:hypothetical protein [Lachnospiraceae bacterium]